MLCEAVGVDRGRGDHDLQVRPARQQLLEVTEQEVDVEAALVRLVDDQRVVGVQLRIGLRLGQQDAVGHQLHRGAALQSVLEPDLVAHHLAERRLQFVGDALGHAGGRNAPGLGVPDQSAAAGSKAAPEFERDLRQLRCLAGTGFAADDDHLVLADRARDLVAPGADRQRFGVADRWYRRGGAGAGHRRRGDGTIHEGA